MLYGFREMWALTPNYVFIALKYEIITREP